jgi:hypothetical protein
MLLNKLDEVKRIAALESRMDHAEMDIRQVQAGVSYLVKQLSTTPPDPPRRKIGFAQDSGTLKLWNSGTSEPHNRSTA